MCSYLRPRNGGVYYTRMVVPLRLRPIIRKTDLGRSLGTKDRAEAKRMLPAWLEEAQSTIAAAEIELARNQGGSAVVELPMTQADRPVNISGCRALVLWRRRPGSAPRPATGDPVLRGNDPPDHYLIRAIWPTRASSCHQSSMGVPRGSVARIAATWAGKFF